jgi:hypothetical protein
MRVTLDLPERIAREAADLAHKVGAPVSELCAHAVEEYVKAASQQQAIDMIHAILDSPAHESHGTEDLLPGR